MSTTAGERKSGYFDWNDVCVLHPDFGLYPDAGRAFLADLKEPEACRYAVVEREVVEHDDRYIPGRDTRQDTYSRSAFLQVSYGLLGTLAADLRAGSMSAGAMTEGDEPPDQFAWGVGLRALVPIVEGSGWAFGTSFEYNRALGTGYLTVGETVIRWDRTEDWRVDFQIEKRWSKFTAYGGLRYSDFRAVYTHDSPYGIREGGWQAADNLGFLLGFNLDLASRWAMGGEVRGKDVTGGLAGSTVAVGSLTLRYGF